jgi:hypothetical protein
MDPFKGMLCGMSNSWQAKSKRRCVHTVRYSIPAATPAERVIFQLSGFVQFLSFTAAISGFCFGFDTGVISASLVSIKDDLGHFLSDQEKE